MVQRSLLPLLAISVLACGDDGPGEDMPMSCGVAGEYAAVLAEEESSPECIVADVDSCELIETDAGLDATCDIAVGDCTFEEGGCDRCTGMAMVSSLSGTFTFDFMMGFVIFDGGGFSCRFDLTPM